LPSLADGLVVARGGNDNERAAVLCTPIITWNDACQDLRSPNSEQEQIQREKPTNKWELEQISSG
jgi:hypothetical protein